MNSVVVPSAAHVERQAAILDAAQQCFVLHGFHRTTMQDVAQAAGMSVGNLYRYFPAKDAVVLALAERDRAEAARHLCDCEVGLWPTLVRLIRQHLVDAPREKAVLLVELWAEGTRNSMIAAMLARFNGENQTWIARALQAAGPLTASQAGDLADRICIESQGIQVARALSPTYDPVPAVERLIESVEAALVQAANASPIRSSSLEVAA